MTNGTPTNGIRGWRKGRLSWRHARQLRRQSELIRREAKLAAIKVKTLEAVGELVLDKLTQLSEVEAERGLFYPTGAPRFQYTVDKIAQAMGVEVDVLVQRWELR